MRGLVFLLGFLTSAKKPRNIAEERPEVKMEEERSRGKGLEDAGRGQKEDTEAGLLLFFPVDPFRPID